MNTFTKVITNNTSPGTASIGRFLMLGTILSVLYFINKSHPADTAYGWISVVPTLMVVGFAIMTHRTVESVLFGTLGGVILLDPSTAIQQLVDVSLAGMQDDTVSWVILVCGLMGALIVLLEKGGSVLSFSEVMIKKIRTKEQSLVTTALLGLLIFIDDYLNAIAISSTMKSVTDKYKVSREKLAYIVDSTAAPICILAPVSTWAIFFSSLLETNGAAAKGEGMSVYISSIPYMAYGWITLIVVFLVAAGKIPDLGAMKKAEKRAHDGQTKPDGAEEMSFSEDSAYQENTTIGMINFIAPIAVLIGASWYFDIDLLAGVIVAIMFTIVFYMAQNLLSLNSMFDSIFSGFKIMLVPLATVFCGFMLNNVNASLGLTNYIIDTVTPYVSADYFPLLIFIITAILVFATASPWGVFIIAMPIIIPLSLHLGAPTPITVGAMLSASAAGGSICFFCDSTVLSAQGSGCTPIQHMWTQLPYALIAIAFTVLFFLAI